MQENQKIGFQEFLSFGYLYLLVLGVVSDSLFYNYFHINILNYSTILDVLLSPLKLVVGNPVILLALMFLLGVLYLSMRFVLPKLKRDRQEQNPTSLWNTFIMGSAFVILCFFLGIGLGKGNKIKLQLEKRNTRPSHLLTFNDKHQEAVKIIGQNSVYIFFVPKNGNRVVVAPISGYISQIEDISTD